MCPGLTSKGAFLDMETEKGAGVQVMQLTTVMDDN